MSDRTRILRQVLPHGRSVLLVGALGAIVVPVVQGARLQSDGQGWSVAEVNPYLLTEGLLAGLAILVVGAVAALVARWFGLGRRIVAGVSGAGLLLLALVGWFVGERRERGPGPAPGPVAGASTVVLITLDTLRRDHVSAYPDSLIPGLTPVLEAFANDAVRFDQARAPAPLTLPVHTSMLTGRLPVDHGILRNGMVLPPSSTLALPERLAAGGYRTAAFTSSSVLHGAHGLARWFSVYRDRLGDHPAREALLLSRLVFGTEPVGKLQKEPGERTVDRALAWLDSIGDEPVFLWVHLYDAHAPHHERELKGGPSGAFGRLPHPCEYVGHPAQRARLSPQMGLVSRQPLVDEAECRRRPWTGLQERLGGYASEVAYADQQVGRLLDGLGVRGRLADAAIVVAADHGESLTEHQQTVSHQFSVYEPVLQVPLLVRPRGGRGAWPPVVETPVGTVQIAATLARLAGIEPLSVDLLAVAEGLRPGHEVDVAIAPNPLPGQSRHAVAIRRAQHKVISLGGGRYERYDLSRDATERFPLRAATDAPTPGPPALRRSGRAKRPRFGLPGLPDPLELIERTQSQMWPKPEDEHAWRPLGAEQAPAFAPLEQRGDVVQDAAEQRHLPRGKVDDGLPEDVKEALQELGYLQ